MKSARAQNVQLLTLTLAGSRTKAERERERCQRAPTMVEGDGFEPDAIPDARQARVERVGDELFLVYQFDTQ
ncbi:MAG: hypothetical protein ACLP1X_16155 [Polyangiaceae bacterium]